MVATEFGRTAAVNGTTGTDHGTGTVAFLVGGAVKGGRMIADWPGLKPEQLYQKRDLKPTTDVRAVAKGVVSVVDGVSSQSGVKSNVTFFPPSSSRNPSPGNSARGMPHEKGRNAAPERREPGQKLPGGGQLFPAARQEAPGGHA